MKRTLMIFTLTALVCIITSVAVMALPYAGTVSLENKTVSAGSSFTIQILLSGGDVDLTSLRVPLKFDGQYITCNYVDFGGSIKPAGLTGNYTVGADEVEIAYIPSVVNPLPLVTAESGLLATLYFTVSADAPEVVFYLDSLNESVAFNQFGTSFYKHRRVEMTGNDASETMLPAFASGIISVQRPTGLLDDDNKLLPGEFKLAQNYPNPFNPVTSIEFALAEKSEITLEVFNVLGRKVATIAEGEYSAGIHRVDWDASNDPSGIYFYRISANSKMDTKKMLFLK
ncbi:MAG: T9SS type A sorting domain-containing protein [Candidatus Zixiibacteriota bacterium]